MLEASRHSAGKQNVANTYQEISVVLINTHTYRFAYEAVSPGGRRTLPYLFIVLGGSIKKHRKLRGEVDRGHKYVMLHFKGSHLWRIMRNEN